MTEFMRTAKKLGNSAGVLIPKKFLGSEVKVTIISRPINVKKEILKLIEDDLGDVLGIYLVSKKPLECFVITSHIKKTIEGNIKISLVPLALIKKDVKINLNLRKKLLEAEAVMNKSLLIDFKKLIRL